MVVRGRAATGWLEGSGLALDNGVVCDETLNAGAPGVYAAGDVVRWFNPMFGETMRLEHWTTAAEQGAVAAANAIEPAAAPCSIVPYFWSDWHDDRIQFVGIPEADEIEVVSGDRPPGTSSPSTAGATWSPARWASTSAAPSSHCAP
ncbi:MAG TPA: FAD-dependent oxidoreductase [Actinophytocola sp.]|uniref:FAD-dependent oxidoreductase n=1 Tax=Actinophytocola sp. TaxID=1872138 RepID=UPI002DF744B8|nr:FAD-dependent oxidoreductase [Actinophytocola sp.]